MSKKSIVLAAASIMTAATVAIGGTLAYFSQEKELKNTFSMGGSSGGDSSFSIVLDESQVTVGEDTNGSATWTKLDARTGADDIGVDYGDLVYPGAALPKDPMITNTGEYPMYARMVVTLPNASIWATALKTDTADALATKVFTGTATGFTRAAVIDETKNELVVTYTWEAVVTPGNATGAAFTFVNIPEEFTGKEAILDKNGDAVIMVKGEAIQSEIKNVTTAAGAFEILDKQAA